MDYHLLAGGAVDLEHLEVARLYLFGQVKFLDLLLLLMAIDIITGVLKAIKNHNLWSRKSLFGYARKLLILLVIIMANVVDQVLSLGGTLTLATVFFYLANEALSITENMAELGVLVPANIAEKLKVIEHKKVESPSTSDIILSELTGKDVDKKLKEGE